MKLPAGLSRVSSRGFLVSLFVLVSACLARAETRPNLVFIIADDCTYRDIGCYGGQAHTPNIDRLATEGMKFTESYQAAPMCSPTRHCIYTGLYPVKSGAFPNHTYVKQGTQSIVHYLKPLGYRVALSGKRHIQPAAAFPFEYSAKQNNPDLQAIDKLMAECRQSETPFCLFACSNEPHSPWNKGDASRYDPSKLELPPYFVDTPATRESMSNYLAEITYYDWQVGQILELLEKHQLSENTLVIVTSEQGSGFPFAKWTCYESGLHNALIARWPGRIKPGSVSTAMIEYVDLTPTFVESAGGKPAAALDGKSYLPVLLGQRDEHKRYVYGLQTTRGIINGSDYYGIRSVRNRKFKYILNLTPEMTFQNAATRGAMWDSWVSRAKSDPYAAERVRRYQHRPAVELYDLTKDPLEWTNLAGKPEYAEVQQELKSQLAQWMKSQGDKGQQTELAAFEHQNKNRNRNANPNKKKKKKNKKNKKKKADGV